MVSVAEETVRLSSAKLEKAFVVLTPNAWLKKRSILLTLTLE